MSAKTCEGCPALVRDKDNQESCIYTRPFTYCPKMKPDYSRFKALAEKWRIREHGENESDEYITGMQNAEQDCADEVEALVKEMQNHD